MTAIKDIGEQGLLKIVQSFCPASVVGDDGALVTVSPGHSLVVTTDVLVDNNHFSDRTTSPEDAGWRAAAANLSDLAAMGATPLGITVGLSLPGEVSLTWVEGLYRGLTRCLGTYKIPIIGGDIVSSPVITISITALGQVLPQKAIKRGGAKPAHVILITGYHGLSRAGLQLLLNPDTELQSGDRNLLVRAHQRPTPRLDLVPYLNRMNQPVGGMDSSDGLGDAIVQICRSSGVGAIVHNIPLHPALLRYNSKETALQWALYGGEDFQLVLALPETEAKELLPYCGEGAAIIGRITEGAGVRLNTGEELNLKAGFQHFGATER
ncbi:MAG: Thiamine-monophosphate kinase [Chroococcopsis gigantea SAG 12.99]|jgi:thiamine-monophosphate kinase|nr:Thiamine-monophosphate kinase [Chroococcopsis gigantea SAG 12.99]